MSVLSSLRSLHLGSPTAVHDLVVVPLLKSEADHHTYTTLDEAIENDLADVTEISETGSVCQLLVKNRSPRAILILDGEELVGAKQNRIVNLTILVAAESTLEIPVTCVEAGRWRQRSKAFSTAGRAHYASSRA